MTNKILNVGLIGLGSMGANHLRILSMLKNVDLKFIYDIDTNLLNKFSKKYNIKISTNIKEDLKKVDAIFIVTPTSTHYEYIKLASKYIKNIFVEKPLSKTLKESRKIENLVEEKKLNIQVGFIERFNPAISELKKILKKDTKIINIDFIRTNKISNRIEDVDVILDLMIHDIDLSIYINGDIKDIKSYGYIQNKQISYARAIFLHQNGVYSNINASRVTEKIIRNINVTSKNKYIECNLHSKTMSIHKQSHDNPYENISINSTEETVFIPPIESLLMEITDFVKKCLNKNFKEGISADIKDSIKTLKAAYFIKKQIEEHYDKTSN